MIEKNKGDWFRIEEIARLSDCCRDSQLERQSLQLVFPFVSVAFLSTSGRRGFELTARLWRHVPSGVPVVLAKLNLFGKARPRGAGTTDLAILILVARPRRTPLEYRLAGGIIVRLGRRHSTGAMRYSIGLIARHQEPGVGLRALPVGDLRPVGAADPPHQRRAASYHEKLSTFESPWVRPYGRLELLPAASLRVRGSRLSP